MNEAHFHNLSWRSSDACESGHCIEVASDGGFVLLRDGKDPDGAVLRFTQREWSVFLQGVKAGSFDEA